MLPACSAAILHGASQRGAALPALLETQGEPLARCEFLLESRRPFGLIVGPPGTGKSDLLRRLASRERARSGPAVVLVDLTGVDDQGLAAELAAEWDAAPSRANRADSLRSLRDRLSGLAACGMRQTLLLDHFDAAAANVAPLIAHLLRLTQGEQSLTVIAAARQPDHPGLQELNRDFGWLRIDLSPLAATETAALARTILEDAGASNRALSAAAAGEVHELTGGRPRDVRRLLDLAAVAAEADDADVIDDAMLQHLAQELTGSAGAR